MSRLGCCSRRSALVATTVLLAGCLDFDTGRRCLESADCKDGLVCLEQRCGACPGASNGPFQVGGSILGLDAAGLALVLDGPAGAQRLEVPAGATAFSFPGKLPVAAGWSIEVAAQPAPLACGLVGAAGKMGCADVAAPQVVCGPPRGIGGTVAGLAGTGLLLRAPGLVDLAVPAGATTFRFAGGLPTGAPYALAVAAQPTAPWQTCAVSGGEGTVGQADVSAAVACTANQYALGGTLSGATAAGLVLRTAGQADLPVPANAATFTFPAKLASGTAYAVTVAARPSSLYCSVANGAGTIGGEDRTDVAVTCVDAAHLPQPQAPVVTAPAKLSTGATAQASVPDQPGMTFSWSVSGGTLVGPAAGLTTSFKAGNPGTLTVWCAAKNAANVAVQGSASVAVYALPAIASFASASSTITQGDATRLTGVFSGGTGAVDHGIGAVASGVATSTGPLAGDTTFALAVTSPAGAVATATTTVHVVPPPAISSFSASPASIVKGASTQLTGVFSGGSGVIDPGGLPATSGVPVTVSPTFPGAYTLTVTNAAGAATSTSAFVQVVIPFVPQDWEGGFGAWYADNGIWSVGAPTNATGPGAAHGGQNVASTGLAQTPPAGAFSRLIGPWFTVPEAAGAPRLRLWHWFNNECFNYGGGLAGCGVSATVQEYGTQDWTVLATWRTPGAGGPWARAWIDLTRFAGKAVRLGFHVETGSGSLVSPVGAWYLDDLALETGTPALTLPETWEAGLGDWYTDNGVWEVGTPTNPSGPGAAHGGTAVASTGLAQDHQRNRDSRLMSPPLTLPPAASAPRLRFWHWFNHGCAQSGGGGPDGNCFAAAGVREVGSATWTDLATWRGSSGGWANPLLDLTAFGGKTVQIGFYILTSEYSAYRPWDAWGAWYVDDVAIEHD